ncbi:MAG: RsmE family RNA methyltransferase [Flavobacteriales bacterium]
MHLFHCPQLGTAIVDLPPEEAHHAVHVLRLSVGDTIGLLDGKGTSAEARITEASKRGCSAQVMSTGAHGPERTSRIHIAVALTKQMDRYEWFLEKATEIGVDRITPLSTHHTERDKLRRDRMEKVLVGAMKQSQRRWLPKLDDVTKLKELVSPSPQPLSRGEGSPIPQKFFGWCEGEHVDLTSVYDPKLDVLMVIGPEGDFTPEEAEMLVANGFRAVSLGKARLRTETAAIAACTWMNFAQR